MPYFPKFGGRGVPSCPTTYWGHKHVCVCEFGYEGWADAPARRLWVGSVCVASAGYNVVLQLVSHVKGLLISVQLCIVVGMVVWIINPMDM